MLESMNLDKQIGEVEKDLNVLEKKTHELSLSIENRGADADDFASRMGERKALLDQKTELLEKRDGLRTQRQTAWDKEMEEGAIALAAKVDIPSERWTPELKALRELMQTGGEHGGPVTLMDYFRAAQEGRPPGGAAGEYNSHIFGMNRAGDFPVEMLHDRDALLVFKPGDWDDIKESEHRASLTGTAVNPGASVNYISQLFSTSESAFCGATFPAVGVGDHSYPIFSKVTTAGDFDRDGAEGAPSGSLTINTATNRRLQATMELASEDENRIPNIAAGLVGHLRMQLQSELDEYLIGTLVSGLMETNTTNGTTATLSAFLALVGGMVDGIAARNVGDVRALLGTGATSLFSLLSGLSLGAGGSHFWEMPRLTDPNFYRGSAHLAAPAADRQQAIFIKTGAGLAISRLQAPIWRRGQMLRDTGVGQLSGTIRYTVAMFAAGEVTATDQHVLEDIDIA